MAGKTPEEKRRADPFLDRRSGEDRRRTYDFDYFSEGGVERRSAIERRQPKERRSDHVRISKWSSVCPKTSTQSTNEKDPS